jgi:predicted ATP-grasp superfamily ATP-dependent carboligase
VSVVLVTDGDQRSTLAVVRSLGRRGHEVHVTSPRGHSLAGASRFAASDIGVGAVDTPDYGRSIVRSAHEVGADHVVPTTEASIRAIAPLAGRLSGQGVPLFDADAFERVSDKRIVLEAATEVGIRIPRQVVLESREDLGARADLDDSLFPSWVKPSRSVAPPDSTGVPRPNPGAKRVRNRAELTALVAEAPDGAFPLLVQGEVDGVGAGVFLLVDGGSVLAVFAHRRVREKPPSGGVSVCRETGTMSAELLETSRRLLERLAWNGVAMVEYKIDAVDGTPVLMEVNGRFWGSLQLAVDAGVDFPALLLDHVEGIQLPPVSMRWPDVRLRWGWGEVDHVWARLRGAGAAGRREWTVGEGVAAVLEVLSLSSRDRLEVFRPDDLGPFWRESGGRMRGLVRRLSGASGVASPAQLAPATGDPDRGALP